jgi:hypothetical protein
MEDGVSRITHKEMLFTVRHPPTGKQKANNLQAPIWLKCTPLTRESFYSSSKTVMALYVISESLNVNTHTKPITQLHNRKATYGPWGPWNWEGKVRIVKAALGTGLAATSWGGAFEMTLLGVTSNVVPELDNIRLYYQDDSFALREYTGNMHGTW